MSDFMADNTGKFVISSYIDKAFIDIDETTGQRNRVYFLLVQNLKIIN